MTEYDNKLDWKHIQEEMSEMKNEFEVLGNAYKMQEEALKKLQKEHETQATVIRRLQKDLQLKGDTYRNKTTRQLAQEAFNQSTVTANWDGLEQHPVIESIYEDLKNRATNEGRRADNILRELENQMSVDEFFEQLNKSSEILEIKDELNELNTLTSDQKQRLDTIRDNVYEKYATQRDKTADNETAIDSLDFLLGEHKENMSGAMIFLMGAFAQLGQGQIEEGLRFMLRIPKVEKDDGEENKQTTETPKA